MKRNIAIVGAGIVGRTLALELHKRQNKVTIFEKDSALSEHSCCATAAGMIAPWSEAAADTSESVFKLGLLSLELWPYLLKELSASDLLQSTGTLHIATSHEKDKLLFLHSSLFKKTMLKATVNCDLAQKILSHMHIANIYSHAVYIAHEAHLNTNKFILATNKYFFKNKIELKYHEETLSLSKNKVTTKKGIFHFDNVIDCRGNWAKNELTELRSVRGELVVLQCEKIPLNVSIRVMHARHPIYITPIHPGVFVIGATTIESDSTTKITVRSELELLNSAISVYPEFLEAQILETKCNLRPAFIDNQPRILKQNDVYFINGMYRHGLMISPAIASIFCDGLEKGFKENEYTKNLCFF